MKLKNNSARPHWIGNVMIAPGAIETVDDEWKGAYNAKDLELVEESKVEEVGEVKRGRKPKGE